ncbi:enoyl-CoA hydratase-related protein [Zobellella sp. An-6]|uniref:enoyl-CoA hydratase-related protein n=1 Tax=Zobellella sp. An-6 TaxID=3400218 RepID=UPI004042C2E4
MNTEHGQDGDGVRHIRLNRPEKRNALDLARYQWLREQLRSAIEDPGVRIIAFAAEGPDFCAGNDLADFLAGPELGPEHPIIELLHALADCPKPLLAGVQGNAVGIGATLLLHMDLVLLAEDARLSFPFVDLGLVPEFTSSLLLPRRLGHVRACQLLLLGDSLDAATARDWGLANQLVATTELPARLEETARRLAAKPTRALLASKALLKAPEQTLLHRAIDQEIEVFRQALAGDEAQALIAALLARIGGR